ncbi:hypothetical protein BpHYR1_017665 [Brachionus plicatilis]|uniref:Uncharacterized protein n=1 Tax=Brachionus plicatilis TaxID=10195 RepID=A0A3M7T1E0_BRAPC|nr:hypothetical protein BpHYR1_017665 [Brachionus plicatilis]
MSDLIKIKYRIYLFLGFYKTRDTGNNSNDVQKSSMKFLILYFYIICILLGISYLMRYDKRNYTNSRKNCQLCEISHDLFIGGIETFKQLPLRIIQLLHKIRGLFFFVLRIKFFKETVLNFYQNKKMIASQNFDNINEKIEATNSATSHDEIKKTDCAESNVKSSNSSSIPSVSSSSFNSFVNSPNTSTSSSPTNKESNTKKKFAKSNYSDPLLDFYNQSYGYYFPYNDMSNPLVNSYYEYAQMFGYPSYPTYFPVEFSQGWIPNGPKVYNGDRRKDKALNSSQKMNQNADANGYQQRRYKKPFNRRGENQKPEEEKPKIVDYDLMKNEQVYVDAFPALEPNSGEKTSQQSAKQDENNSTDETIGVNKENELKRVNSGGWAGKKWSEIVNGNQLYPEYHEANGSKQKDNGESSLEKQMNGLNIQDTLCNSETCSQKSERTNSKKSNYKKNNYDPNYYYNQNSQITLSNFWNSFKGASRRILTMQVMTFEKKTLTLIKSGSMITLVIKNIDPLLGNQITEEEPNFY